MPRFHTAIAMHFEWILCTSIGPFPHIDGDSDIANNWVQNPFVSDSDSDAYIFNRGSVLLCGNRSIAIAIAVWKRAIRCQWV